MADNLLDQIRKVVREENEPLKKGQKRLEQGQAQTNTTLGQVKTVVETLEAGQKEMRETMATKADVLSVGVKVDKLRKRVEGIEEDTGSTPRHKN
jgi:peptidoglycan hydrolase CwlO-like protein